MSDTGTNPTKWRDPAGNVYSVEKSVKTGRFIVIRTNPGGNRKAAKQFETVGSAAKDLGRKATLIEREERYCEIAASRMAQEVLPLEYRDNTKGEARGARQEEIHG